MIKLLKFEFNFVLWHESGQRHGGRGYMLAETKNIAARKIKVKLSTDLDVPPADINVTSLKRATQ